MKAFKMKNRPDFQLFKQYDSVHSDYLQMPRMLFNGEKKLTSNAVVAYTLLFNLMKLSQKKGWINEYGEVFVVFTRESLAEKLTVGYRKATAVFRELSKAGLIWEKRSGRGFPNQIYIANLSALAETTVEEPFKDEQTDASRTAGKAVQEPSKQPTSYIDNNKKENFYNEKSLSAVSPREECGVTDIFESSEVDSFPEGVSSVFKSAMLRLFNAGSYESDAGRLTRPEIRRYLKNLNSIVLEKVYQKVAARKGDVSINQLGYLSQAILNAAVADGGRTNAGIYDEPDYLSDFRKFWSQPEVAVCT